MKVLLTGGAGMLGTGLWQPLADRGIELLVTDLDEERLARVPPSLSQQGLDVRCYDELARIARSFSPDGIVHLAALTDVEWCESHPEETWVTHVVGTQNAARVARSTGASLVNVSTSAVFDGALPRPYDEFAPVSPRSVYGRSKAAAEAEALRIHPEAFILRAGWMAGGGRAIDEKMVGKVTRRLLDGERRVLAVADRLGSLTVAPSVGVLLPRLLTSGRFGTYHVVNRGYVTHYDIVSHIVDSLGLRGLVDVVPVSDDEFASEYHAPRPDHERLDDLRLRVEGFPRMPDWRVALREYVIAWF